MCVYADDYVVYVYVASGNAFKYVVQQSLKVGRTRVKSLRRSVISKLAISGNAEACSFKWVNECLLKKSLGQIQDAKYLPSCYFVQKLVKMS